jgi:hypothetical protein
VTFPSGYTLSVLGTERSAITAPRFLVTEAGGLYKLRESILTHSLKPPGVNP